MGNATFDANLPPRITVGPTEYDVTPLLAGEEIQSRVEQMGKDLAEHYDERGAVHVLTVLNGALHFASDLRRTMQRANPGLAITSDQIRVSSYTNTTSSGMVRLRSMPEGLADQHVLIVEDIFDSGLTLNWLLRHMKTQDPASIEVAVLLDKENPTRSGDILDQTEIHAGFQIPNDFVVGYGLDVAQRFRDLDAIYKLVPVVPAQE